MSASTAGARSVDRRSGSSPSGRRHHRLTSWVVAAAVAVALAVVVHAVSAVVAGGTPSLLAAVVAGGSTLTALAAARACGLGQRASALAALLSATSAVAVAACAAPGSAAVAMLLVPALAAMAHRLLPRPATAAVVLALGPLAAVAPFLGGALGGWGAGPTSWRPGASAASVAAELDPVLPLAVLVAAVALLCAGGTARHRWLGGAALAAGAVVVLLGLPAAALAPAVVPGCLALVSAAAALVSTVTRRAAARPAPGHQHRHAAPTSQRLRLRSGRGAAVAVAAVGVLLLAPTWSQGVVRASTAGDPAAAAARWLSGRQAAGGGVAVDPGLYDAVVTSSPAASRVVPAGAARAAGSEPAARWLVAGPQLRSAAVPGSWAASALASSHLVAVFGEGEQRIEVRELASSVAAPSRSASPSPSSDSAGPAASTTAASPTVTSAPPAATATPASQESLDQLLENSRLDFSPRARLAVQTHPVDLRLAALLVQLAATQPLSVSDLPIPDGGDEPLRTAVLDGVAGEAVGADPGALQVLERQVAAQDAAYRAVVTQEQEGTTTVLRVMLPPAGTS